MKLARVKEELTKQTKDAVSEVENKMRFLKKGIKNLQRRVSKKVIASEERRWKERMNWNKIVLCQSKITFGLKRKTELNEELRKSEEKKMKVCTQCILLYFYVSWQPIAFLEPLNSINSIKFNAIFQFI